MEKSSALPLPTEESLIKASSGLGIINLETETEYVSFLLLSWDVTLSFKNYLNSLLPEKNKNKFNCMNVTIYIYTYIHTHISIET